MSDTPEDTPASGLSLAEHFNLRSQNRHNVPLCFFALRGEQHSKPEVSHYAFDLHVAFLQRLEAAAKLLLAVRDTVIMAETGCENRVDIPALIRVQALQAGRYSELVSGDMGGDVRSSHEQC